MAIADVLGRSRRGGEGIGKQARGRRESMGHAAELGELRGLGRVGEL
jgi:hypothetical protein